MANNLIQIKKSATTAVPASLANGEFAYTSNGDILFIGRPDGSNTVTAIAGKRFPGTLTANQSLVANSTSGIDKVIVANLVPQVISANGSFGGAGHVLKSSGSGTANVYWEAVTTSAGVAGSDTQIQYNDGGSTLAGAVGFTYSKTTNNVSIANTLHIPANNAFGNVTTGGTLVNSTTFASGNSTVNATHTSSLVQVTNSTGTANLTAIDLKIGTSVVNTTVLAAGANVIANTISFFVGNSVANAVVAATLIKITNSTSTANLSPVDLVINTSVVNSTVIAAGANVVVSTSSVFVGNSTVNATHTSSLLQVTNSTATANLTALALTVGTSVVNTTVLAAGANVIANTTALFVGNSTVNAIHNSTLLQVSNSTAIANLSAIDLKFGGYGNTTTGGSITNNVIFVVGNSSVNTSVKPTEVLVGANVIINTTAFDVGATVISSANAIFGGSIAVNGSIGTAGYVLISGGSTNAYWSNSLPGVFNFTDVTVSGNLTVLGDLVSLNVSSLAIEDPLIVLAKDQAAGLTYTDAVDIGFVAPYGNTTVANSNWTGFFRDQNDNGVYKLFSGNIPTPTTTVDTANVNFTFATFQSQLKAGGVGAGALIANSTVVNITANSTVSVAITGNTLSLSTALPATSGGTGQSTYAVGDLLVGGATNTLSKLSAGSDGYVLQINGTGVVAWNTLDGGTF